MTGWVVSCWRSTWMAWNTLLCSRSTSFMASSVKYRRCMGTKAGLNATGMRRTFTLAGFFLIHSSNAGSKLKQWTQL